jgi:hypothetical protein
MGDTADRVQASTENLIQETSLDDLEPQQLRDLQRAADYIKKVGGQAKAAAVKISTREEKIEGLESRKRIEDLDDGEKIESMRKLANFERRSMGKESC